MAIKNMRILFLILQTLCVHTLIEEMEDKVIDRYMIPIITRGYYDPFYIKPLQSVKKVQAYISCPILIHCSRNDEILKNDESITQFYDQFSAKFFFNTSGKQVNSYFLLSDDDTHDTNNLHYKEVSHNFFKLNQEAFTNYHLEKQYSISHSFKNRTLLLQDRSRVAKEIADLKRNSISEFFSLGYSVLQSLTRF